MPLILSGDTGVPVTTVTGTLPVANGGTGGSTSTGTGAVVLASSPSLTTPALGTPASGNLANCTGTVITTLAAQVASTSGTAIDFTGIPAGVKEIKIMFVGTACSTTSNFLIQLGDAGGMETSGYSSTAYRDSGGIVTSTAGLIVASNMGASQTYHGTITLTLENSTAFTWTMTSTIGTAGGGNMQFGSGSKSLSQELTQVRITTVAADAFNAGAINIQYRS